MHTGPDDIKLFSCSTQLTLKLIMLINVGMPTNTIVDILYSYFIPVCSIVKTITPRCRGRPDALLHDAEGRVQ